LEFPNKEAPVDASVRREFSLYLDETCSRIDADPEGGRLSGIYRHSIAALLNRPFMRAIYEDDGQVLSGLLGGAERYQPRVLLGAECLRTMADADLLRSDIDSATASHLLAFCRLARCWRNHYVASGKHRRSRRLSGYLLT
jgi:hypothetical protein